MKPKRFNKRLVLNKKTISNLENVGLTNVKGGITPACPTFYSKPPFANCCNTDNLTTATCACC